METGHSKPRPKFWIIAVLCSLAVAASLALGMILLAARSQTKVVAKPSDPFPLVSPEKAGFSSRKLAEGIESLRKEEVPIHSLILMRGGKLLFEAYFEPYAARTYHKIASVTKSFTTTLIGVAVGQGLLGLDDPILSFFPDRSVEDPDGRKARITVRHLLTCSSGMKGDPRNDETVLAIARKSADWVKYALDRPMIYEPGSHFVYSGLDMHLLSAIITRVSGKSAWDYAKEFLFGPLGFGATFWDSDPDGNSRGWGDLCLMPRDMIKLGMLYRDDGVWGETRLLPEGWVAMATKKQVATGATRGEDYGYGFWPARESERYPYYQASGMYGQVVRYYPAFDLLVSWTGGGVEADQVMARIGAAIVDLEGGMRKRVKPDLAGEEILSRALALQGAKSEPRIVPLPREASSIQGAEYLFDENPLGLEAIRFSFPSEAEAEFDYRLKGDRDYRHARIGLDGLPRTSLSGLPLYLSGVWTAPSRLEIAWNEGPGMERLSFGVKFAEREARVAVAVPGASALVEMTGRRP